MLYVYPDGHITLTAHHYGQATPTMRTKQTLTHTNKDTGGFLRYWLFVQ